MSANNRRRAKKLKYIKALKNIFLISIIGSAFLYQILWFNSFNNISVSYELESYDEQLPESKNFGEYIDSLFTFMKENPINLTYVADDLIEKNSTLIQELGKEINETIKNGRQIYDAYLNDTLSRRNITRFFDSLWNNATKYIPANFLNPAKIEIYNGGLASVHSISFIGKAIINNRSAAFLKNSNNQLSPNEQLIIQITLLELIKTIIQLGLDFLIGLTIEILEETSQVYNTTIIYLNEFARKFELSLSFDIFGRFGLLPINLIYSVNLLSIFNHLNLERVLG